MKPEIMFGFVVSMFGTCLGTTETKKPVSKQIKKKIL
jgi:hypothetical protein